MVVQQMHLKLETAIQKNASYQFDTFTREEFDDALNLAVERFIQTRFPAQPSAANPAGGTFPGSERGLMDLEAILEKNVRLPVFQLPESDPRYEPYMVFCPLPSNLLFRVNDRSFVVAAKDTMSGGSNCTPQSQTTTEQVSYHLFRVALPLYRKTDPCPYYKDLKLTAAKGSQPETLVDLSTTAYANGFEDQRQRFMVTDLLVQGLNKVVPLSGYWEQYDERFYNQELIWVIPATSGYTDLRLTLNGTTTAATRETITYTRVKVSGEAKATQSANRVLRSEPLYDQINHPFGKPRTTSPVSTIAGNRLYAYYTDNFGIVGITMDYLRKPRLISLALGQSCDLAAHTHQIIVDMAAEYLKLSAMSPDYQLKAADNARR